jgi:hypothetical protein
VVDLAVDDTGTWLAAAHQGGQVRVWDIATRSHQVTLVADKGGTAALYPDGRYQVSGRPEGLWWTAGLCRFEVDDLAELAPYTPGVRQMPQLGEDFV